MKTVDNVNIDYWRRGGQNDKYIVNEAYNKLNYCNWIHQFEGTQSDYLIRFHCSRPECTIWCRLNCGFGKHRVFFAYTVHQ